jgi:3',5'-nucleoside bisphosphate phosphatase
MLNKGDFHIHSTASDGFLSPEEIVVTARSRGIDIIAITDHNTIAGIQEAVDVCKQYNVFIIPGVELSTKYNNESIHILGYFRNFNYRENIFENALKAVKTHQYKKVRSLLSNYRASEYSGEPLSVFEGIHLLKKFGAAVVLAHPVRINKKNLKEILDIQFEGLEAKYCHNTDEDTAYFVRAALARFSFYTGGSDFHTNKINDVKHCNIGQPYLSSSEIQMFLRQSRVVIFGDSNS